MKEWEPARKQGDRSDRDERQDKRETRREQWAMMALFIRCVHAQLLDAHPQEGLCLAFFTPFQILKDCLN
jgi:hypothetical protein